MWIADSYDGEYYLKRHIADDYDCLKRRWVWVADNYGEGYCLKRDDFVVINDCDSWTCRWLAGEEKGYDCECQQSGEFHGSNYTLPISCTIQIFGSM